MVRGVAPVTDSCPVHEKVDSKDLTAAEEANKEAADWDTDTLDYNKPWKQWTRPELMAGVSHAVDCYKEKADRVDELEKLVDTYQTQLQKTGKSFEEEVDNDVLEEARCALKTVVFRKSKLISAKKESEVTKMTNAIYDLIKGKFGFEEKGSLLSKLEFNRIYKKKLLVYYSGIRSTLQSSIKNAVYGEYFCMCQV